MNDGFKFEKGIIADKEYNQLEKECLKSFESLCVFGYREYYKNLLCILVEFYNRKTGKATPVPRPMMEIFDLFYPPLINHMMRQGKFKKTSAPTFMQIGYEQIRVNYQPYQFNLIVAHYLVLTPLLTI